MGALGGWGAAGAAADGSATGAAGASGAGAGAAAGVLGAGAALEEAAGVGLGCSNQDEPKRTKITRKSTTHLCDHEDQEVLLLDLT